MNLAFVLRKRFVLAGFAILIGIAVAASLVVTLNTPRVYKATTKILVSPAYISSGPGFSLGGAQMNLSTYVAFVEDYNFRRKVLSVLRTKNRIYPRRSALEDIDVSANSVPDTSLLEISATAKTPGLAKDAANTSAEVLSREDEKLRSTSREQMAKRVRENQIRDLDKKLAELRAELEILKTSSVGTAADRITKIAALQDEIDNTKSARAIYSDFITRADISEMMNKNNLRIVYPAVLPDRPFKPNMAQNLATALLASVLVGVAMIFLINYTSPKEQLD